MGCGNSRDTTIEYSMRYTAKSIVPTKKSFEEKMKTLTLLLVGNENSSFSEIKSELNLKSDDQKMIGEMNGMVIEAFLRTNDRNELPNSYPESVIDFVIGVIDEDCVADHVFYYVKSRKLCSHCIIINKTKRSYYDDKIGFLIASDLKNLIGKEIKLINDISERFKKNSKELFEILGDEVTKNEFFGDIMNNDDEIIQNFPVNLDNKQEKEGILHDHLRFSVALKSPKNNENFSICKKRLLIAVLIRRTAYYATERAREVIEKLEQNKVEINRSENLLYIGSRDKTLNGISVKLNLGLGKYFDKVYKTLSLSAKYNFASAIFELKCKSEESAAAIIKYINSMIDKYHLKELMGENFDRFLFIQKKDKVVFEAYLSEEIYELGQLLIRSIGLEKIKLSFDHLFKITTNINFKNINIGDMNFDELLKMLLKTEISSEFYGDNLSLFLKIFGDTFKKCSEIYNKRDFWRHLKPKDLNMLDTALFFINTYFSTKFELTTDVMTAYSFLIGFLNYLESERSYEETKDSSAYEKVFEKYKKQFSNINSEYISNFSKIKTQLSDEFSAKNHIDLSLIELIVVVPSLRLFVDLSLNLPDIDHFINRYI